MKRACVNVTCLSRMMRKCHVRFLGGKGAKTRPTRPLVALVLYGLSAPHTASVFDKLTPGWGWIAPVGVEFGLLYRHFVGGTHILQAKLFPGHCAHLKSCCS